MQEKCSIHSTIRHDESDVSVIEKTIALPKIALAPHISIDIADEETDLSLGETLGEGGMGRVYRAQQHSLRRDVVAKVPLSEDSMLKKRLLQESWVMGRLEHPNIVPIYQLGENEGRPMLIMKYIEGIEWSELLHKEATPPPFLEDVELSIDWHIRTLIQVCHALEYAHSRDIIHRDLKPENIMLGPFGEVYILDWGVAVSLRDEDKGFIPLASELRSISGTPTYMAPEMLLYEEMPTDARTDVYLLGAILYRIVMGVPPHFGHELPQIFMKIINDATREYTEDIPKHLVDICERAMAFAPEERFASVKDVRKALQDYLQFRDSRRLSERASKGLTQLKRHRAGRNNPELTILSFDLHEVFIQSRFGFQQALEIWPENTEAQEGLQELLQEMFWIELSHDELKAAARILSELEESPATLVEAFEKKKQQLAQRDEEVEALKQLAFEKSFHVGAKGRRVGALSLAILWGLGPLLVWIFERIWQREFLGHVHVFAINASFGLFLAAAFYLGRNSMLKNQAGRQLAKLLVVLFLAFPLQRIGLMVMGIAFRQTIIIEYTIFSLFLAILSIFIDPRMWYAALLYVGAFFLSIVWPVHIFLIAGVVHLFSMLIVAWSWGPNLFLDQKFLSHIAKQQH